MMLKLHECESYVIYGICAIHPNSSPVQCFQLTFPTTSMPAVQCCQLTFPTTSMPARSPVQCCQPTPLQQCCQPTPALQCCQYQDQFYTCLHGVHSSLPYLVPLFNQDHKWNSSTIIINTTSQVGTTLQFPNAKVYLKPTYQPTRNLYLNPVICFRPKIWLFSFRFFSFYLFLVRVITHNLI